MARDTKAVYADIDFGSTVASAPGAKIVIRTNIPVGWLGDLDNNKPATIIDFMARVIAEWEGFDMPLTRESIASLTLQEIKTMLPKIEAAVMSPPVPE